MSSKMPTHAASNWSGRSARLTPKPVAMPAGLCRVEDDAAAPQKTARRQGQIRPWSYPAHPASTNPPTDLQAFTPPSTVSTDPVTKRAPGLARKATAAAMSSVVP